ncbi:MAG: polymer-forming cytoskeletal protein [Acidobacteria bacterium]|nr:polymer-forming cytoskeletal protein [Acidobacteriota bacterium]MCA1611201.1 polymer-forming cytoskeletal protein [Acidobacteriota bacterium]
MKSRNDGATLNGFLDRGSHFQGELTFEDTFRIDGRFEGKIRSGSELILGDSADVNADIEVGRLSVNGKLSGSVHATERIELLARSRVFATLSSPVLKVEEGAFFQGTCQMSEKPAAVLELRAVKE